MRRPNVSSVIRLWSRGRDSAEIAALLRCRESDVANLIACNQDRRHANRVRAARLANQRSADRAAMGIQVQAGPVSLARVGAPA